MTGRDFRAVHTLYYFHRYNPSAIARLFSVPQRKIKYWLDKSVNETVIAETDCQICGNEDGQNYYIDGNNENNKPQNIIMLCEPDKRRFQHLRLSRILKLQLGSSQPSEGAYIPAD